MSRKVMICLCLVCAFGSIPAVAQTVTTIANFDGTNGEQPYYVTLVQGRDGNLWGTTTQGGSTIGGPCLYGCGTVFKVSLTGALETVYSFTSPLDLAGTYPLAGLALGVDGNLYGVAQQGGGGSGTVFKVTPPNTVTGLNYFDGSDGQYPEGALTQGTDGQFYGTTNIGGPKGNGGTVFKITSGGALTLLHSFSVYNTFNPVGQLVEGSDGAFYGTTSGENSVESGTVFKITSTGKFTTLHTFSGQDGAGPVGGLFQGPDGNFYGTTADGGQSPNCFSYGCGTIFKITPSGSLTTLFNFDSIDGSQPVGPLVLGTDGNFYGITYSGTVFQITLTGVFTDLDSGSGSRGGLVQAANGKFYGVTWQGGTNFDGSVFSLDMGLGPFVKLSPAYGPVGHAIGILGYGLTGTTSVTFNGVPATFTLKSNTFLTAIVPAGATSGPVQVTTPSGTLMSNPSFQVKP